MKKIFLITTIFVSIFIFIENPKAYVRVESDVEFFNPQESSAIVNGQFNWGTGTQVLKSGPWIYSPGQYFAVGGVQGDNLIVDADYYFGVRGLPYTDATMNNYLNNARNTVTSSNLRCGIGAYGSGYDSTYLPQVTNFEVTFEEANNSTGNYILYHIKFTYNQRIKEVTANNTNVWCYFQRNPSDGLFLQPSSPNGGGAFYYFSYTRSLKYAVTNDPNTKLLTELTNQNQVLIDQTKDLINNTFQTIDKLDDLNNNIKDDDIDTSSSNSFFDSFDDKDHGGLSSIITAPLSAFNKITATCKPISMKVLDKEITLPCGDTLFWNKPSVKSFRVIWNLLLGGPILYFLLIKLFRVIEGLKNPDDDRIEVLDL